MIPRDLISWFLNKNNVPKDYIEIIKNMYEGVVTSVRDIYGETCKFSIMV